MYPQPGGRTGHTVLGHRRIVLGDRVNSQGAVVGSVHDNSEGAAGFPGGCDYLVWIILQAERELKLLLRDKQDLYLIYLIRKIVWVGGLMLGRRLRRMACL